MQHSAGGQTTPGIATLIIVLIIANMLWPASAAAQSMSGNGVFGRYQQANWQERDGLPQNTVLAVTTTRDGYLWVGTYEGAARFDGVRCTLFNPSTTTGIGNSMVTSLLERRDGDLWLATYGGGVSRLSGGQFTQFAIREGLSSDFTTCLFEDHAGTLWIGTDGGGVDSFAQGRFSAYTVAQGLPSNLVRAIVDDGDGALLVGTSRGIARIADGRVSAYEGRADVVHADIRTLARPPDRSLWVAALSGGLYRIDSHGVVRFGRDHGLTNDVVESLFVDEDGLMWVGTANGGVFRYAAGRFESYAPVDGLPGARVPVIVQGVDNGLWIGTDGGLVRLKKPRFTVYTQRDGLAWPDRLPDDGFNPHGISIDEAHNLMVTSDFICPLRTLHVHGGSAADLRGSVRVWDLARREITKTIIVGDPARPAGTMEVQLIPRDQRLRAYTAGMADNTLYLVDPERGTATAVFDFDVLSLADVPAMPQLLRMNKRGTRLFVTLNGAGKVVMFDIARPDRPKLMSVVDLGPGSGPHFMRLTSDDKRLVVTDYFLVEDLAPGGIVNVEGDHKIHAINVHGNRLEPDTAFDVDFDRDISTGPARPHGVVMLPAQVR